MGLLFVYFVEVGLIFDLYSVLDNICKFEASEEISTGMYGTLIKPSSLTRSC